MRRFLKRLFLAFVLLAIGAVGTVYALSERAFNRRHDVGAAPFALPIPVDSASLAEGERIARTRGCFGCHGDTLEGKAFLDDPMVARLIAPNLTTLVRAYSAAEFERVLRHGTRPDGRTVYAMPSDMYRSLTDADVANLIGYIAALPQRDGETRATRMGPLGRIGLALGQYPSARQLIETETPLPPPTDAALHLGHYVAVTSCVECHGPDMRGWDGSPSLPAVLTAYTAEEFAAFLESGKAKGDRELPMMSAIARDRLSHLTDEEAHSLHAYLLSLGVRAR